MHLSGWTVFQRLSAIRTGKASADNEAGDGSRQAGGQASKSLSVRPAVPTGLLLPSELPFPCGKPLCHAFRSYRLPCRSKVFVAPSAPRQFGQRLRATRCICGSPSLFGSNLQGVFSNAAAGIAAASFGLNFSVSFRGLLLQERGNFFPFDEGRLRLMTESRKYFL